MKCSGGAEPETGAPCGASACGTPSAIGPGRAWRALVPLAPRSTQKCLSLRAARWATVAAFAARRACCAD